MICSVLSIRTLRNLIRWNLHKKECMNYIMNLHLKRLSEYCAKHNLYVEYIIKDCGSGLDDKRNGFTQLTDLIVKGKVNKVVIEHKDRLTRFQFNFINKMYDVFGCEIVVLDDKEDVSDAEELTRDLMALLASFSGKYYGRRSLERRKHKN